MKNGSLAQLVERHVYTVDVIGSIPVGPTNKSRILSRGYGTFLCLLFVGYRYTLESAEIFIQRLPNVIPV